MSFPVYWLGIAANSVNYVEVFGGYERVKSYWTGYRSFFIPDNPKLKGIPKGKVLMFKLHKEERVREYNYGESEFQVKTVRADTLHKLGLTGNGVKVGIFDTGFDLNHNSLRGVIVGGQMDFNSGDRLNFDGNSLPTPTDNAFYIHSYDCAYRGAEVYCVFSGIGEGDIAGTNINRWDLYLAKYNTSWSLKRLSVGFEINPDLTLRNDTVYLVWSSYGFLKFGAIYTDTFESVINLTSGYSAVIDTFSGNFVLGIYTGDSIKLCNFSTSLNCTVSKYSRGFGGMYLDGDSLAFSDGDSIFVFKGSSFRFENLGFYPVIDSGRLAYIRNDSLFVNGDFITSVKVLENFALSGDSIAVPMEDYISIMSVSSRSEIRKTGWTFCDKPKFINGKLVFRERGDTIAEAPKYGTGRYHGTRVLSVMAGYVEGTLIGISPGAKYYLAKTEKVSRSDTTTNWENRLEEDFFVAALEWAARKGVKIINASLGYGSDLGYTKDMMDGKTAISSRATSEALKRGILPVISIGNVSSRSVDPNVGDTTLTAPADAFDIVSVGGVIYDSTSQKVVFSSNSACGPSSDGRVKPEVVAPFEVVAADDSNRTVIASGTSYAAPITSGVLALALEAHPSWTLEKLRNKLLETAKPLEDIPFKPNYCTGYGLVDAAALVFSEPLEVKTDKRELFFERIYPNPVSKSKNKKVVLRVKAMFPTVEPVLRIYTPFGALVREISIKGTKNTGLWEYTLDVGDLEEGLYVVVLMTERGIATGKFVVVK